MLPRRSDKRTLVDMAFYPTLAAQSNGAPRGALDACLQLYCEGSPGADGVCARRSAACSINPMRSVDARLGSCHIKPSPRCSVLTLTSRRRHCARHLTATAAGRSASASASRKLLAHPPLAPLCRVDARPRRAGSCMACPSSTMTGARGAATAATCSGILNDGGTFAQLRDAAAVRVPPVRPGRLGQPGEARGNHRAPVRLRTRHISHHASDSQNALIARL